MISGPPLVDIETSTFAGGSAQPIGGPFFVGDWKRLAIFFGTPNGTAQRLVLRWLRTRDDGVAAGREQTFDVDAGSTVNPPRLVWFPPVLMPWVRISIEGVGGVGQLHVYPTNMDPGAQTPPKLHSSTAVGGLLAAWDGTVPAGGTRQITLPPYVGRAHVLLQNDGVLATIDIESFDHLGNRIARVARPVNTPEDEHLLVHIPSLITRATLFNLGGVPTGWAAIVAVPTP